MREPDRIGVEIVATSLLAGFGYAVGGLPGTEISAVLPEVVRHLTVKRARNVERVLTHAGLAAGMTGPQLVEWVRASDQNAAYIQDALEAAWETLEPAKLRSLGCVLADGMTDSAKLDTDQLVIPALRDLESPHFRVLAELARVPVRLVVGQLRERLPNLSDGMDSLVATLERTGCIAPPELPSNARFLESLGFAVTDFGRLCLRFVEASQDHARPDSQSAEQ